MDATFWHSRWETNDTGFHQSEANPALVKYFKKLSLNKGSRVFVPLCGKTLDISWLLDQGYSVVGAELSEKAITQLFAQLRIKPEISDFDKLKHYKAPSIDILIGDIFDISKEILGRVDAIYDRAALVALPKMTRQHYTQHLREITDNAPQLLLTFQYDQNLIEGPPFSVDPDEVDRHYKSHYNLTHLHTSDVPDGLKGKYPAKENVWLLTSVRG